MQMHRPELHFPLHLSAGLHCVYPGLRETRVICRPGMKASIGNGKAAAHANGQRLQALGAAFLRALIGSLAPLKKVSIS